MFDIQGKDGHARAGLLATSHGQIPTPIFIPVATQASVKTLSADEVRHVGAGMVLANTYHLYLRPGIDLIQRMGGLHQFMAWDGPILTDSGGFQAYSLGNFVPSGSMHPLSRVTKEGIVFKSHLDGSEHPFTPESCIKYQEALGADIIMPLDLCMPYGVGRDGLWGAIERTYEWALRSRQVHRRRDQALFGIIQGGTLHDLRSRAVESITSLDFPGYAIGGLSVGESKEELYDTVEKTASLLPVECPRYLMGVGSPEDLVVCAGMGVDLFDCVLPTRVARHGSLFTLDGRVNITNARFRAKDDAIQEECDCLTCSTFSIAYLHHLFKAQEILGYRLATIHNLRFVFRLMEDIRVAILGGNLEEYQRAFLARYRPADRTARGRALPGSSAPGSAGLDG